MAMTGHEHLRLLLEGATEPGTNDRVRDLIQMWALVSIAESLRAIGAAVTSPTYVISTGDN